MTTDVLRAKTLLMSLAGCLALTAGCHDEQVEHTRVTKDAEASALPANHPTLPAANAPVSPEAGTAADARLPPNHPAIPGMGGEAGADPNAPSAPAGMKGDVPMPPKPTGAEGLSWTLPEGWTQTLTGGIRYATLKPPGGGAIDASVVVLPGPAGGELANVNRWRGQIGLPPLDEATLPAQRKAITTPAGPISLYDFSSEGGSKTRLVAGVALVDGSSWFFKMTGDATSVGTALPGFTALVSSLRSASHAN